MANNDGRDQAEDFVGCRMFVDGGRRILGSNYGSTVAALDFPTYAELYKAGRLPIDLLVTHRIGLDDVERAFDDMRRGEGVRQVIVLDR